MDNALQEYGLIAELNSLLADTSRLESLYIHSPDDAYYDSNSINKLLLPTSLHSLTLCYKNVGKGIWDAPSITANEEVFARLRSLHLDAREDSVEGLNMCVNLVYLGVRLDAIPDHSTFIEALGRMPCLRVLIMAGDISPPVVRALPGKCPQLQHLSLFESYDEVNEMDSLARMEHLISLSVQEDREVETRADWSWLEAIAERGLLEYLDIESEDLPTGVACYIIKKCKVWMPIQLDCISLVHLPRASRISAPSAPLAMYVNLRGRGSPKHSSSSGQQPTRTDVLRNEQICTSQSEPWMKPALKSSNMDELHSQAILYSHT